VATGNKFVDTDILTALKRWSLLAKFR